MRATLLNQTVSDTAAHQGTWYQVSEGGGISFQLATQETIAGSWQILASNKPDVAVNGDPNATDVTAAFKDKNGDALASVSSGGSSQYVQAGPLWAGAVTAVFTGSSGTGPVLAYVNEAAKP